MSEQELAEGCKKGDNRARKELYELFAQPMLCLCFRYVADLEQAQDLLHDGFLKVFSSISSYTYQGEGSLRAWMSRVFTNLALGFLRANKLLPSLVPLETIADTADETDETDANRLPIDVLMRLVSELPPGYRTVFNLYVFEEWSHKEIAAYLHIQEKSSASQLNRARKMLMERVRWERLEADLKELEKPARRRSVWWRWLAAAALLAGITFSGWWLWQMPEVKPLPEEVVTESVPEEVRPIIPEVEVLPLAYLSVPKEEISLHSVAIPEEKTESISEEPEIVSASEEAEETEETMPETSVWTLPEEEQPRRRKGSWSFGLAAGGSGAMNLSLASADNDYVAQDPTQPGGDGSYGDGDEDKPEEDLQTRGLSAVSGIREPSFDYHHRLPISFGLSARYAWKPDLGIETGLTYTWLYSSLRSGSYRMGEQSLHYLGIPLKLNWTFWRKDNLSFYMSGGVLQEYCVSARRRFVGEPSHSLPVNRWQTSIQGGLGFQVQIYKSFSIYLEPNFGYYFDMLGTNRVETYRTENPLNIGLQIGVRFGK